MISTGPLQVAVERLEDGRFFVWCDADPATTDWKQALFAWHAATFYGTALSYTDIDSRTGVCLDPWTAIGFLAFPRPMESAKWVWTDSFAEWRQAAQICWDALENGRFMPDAARWDGEFGRWKLTAPPDEPAMDAPSRRRAEMLLDAGLRHLLSAHPPARELYRQLLARYPILGRAAADADMPEEDWLEQAGFAVDDCPFRILLRLGEPEPEDGTRWPLHLVLQDAAQPQRQFDVSAAKAAGPPDTMPDEWKAHWHDRYERTVRRWIRLVPELEDPKRRGRLRSRLDENGAWHLLTEGCLRLAAAGHPVLLPEWWDVVRSVRPSVRAAVKAPRGGAESGLFSLDQLVEFDWKVSIGGEPIPAERFLQMVRNGRKLWNMRDRWVVLDPAYLERLQTQIRRLSKHGMTLREVLEAHLGGQGAGGATLAEAETAGDASEPVLKIDPDKPLSEWMDRLHDRSTMPRITPSPRLRAQLREYQLTGASWMVWLGRFGLGGCLADDMGLGKTVQWIAYLLHMQDAGEISSDSPALLICPTSVLGNWQKELEKFAPDLTYYVHYGTRRAKGDRFREAIRGAALVLTTYPLAHPDREELQSVEWSSICLDEAQHIKNALTKQSSAIRRLRGRQRFALTGTPVENRLSELWAIFDFLNPGYLGGRTVFRKQYELPIAKGHTEKLSRLRRLIQPFVLRRVKQDPAIRLDLPEKYETKAYLRLTAEQAAHYEAVVHRLLEAVDLLPAAERRALILASLTRLKQVCDHPALLKEHRDRLHMRDVRPEQSYKCVRLLEMVRDIRAEDERCLVFTQFVQMGELLRQWLEHSLREPVEFLHGGVPRTARDEMIARFQGHADAKERPGVFVLSLKAGGTGLNLTAANHVIHFDRWWNPAVENQATDRAFRIGQTKDVQVHKLITLGTLEERIDELIERKRELSEQIVGAGEQWITELSTDELRDLFALRKQWVED